MSSTPELLVKTSRTFALAIPLLPEPTRTATRLAYLLFRIADTFEDSESWPRVARLAALAELCELLRSPDSTSAHAMTERWLAAPPTQHEGYLDLLRSIPGVLAELEGLDADVRRIVVKHAQRTASGMSKVLRESGDDGHVQVKDLAGLRAYCYLVAGIVGELLTELFIHDVPPLSRVQATLVQNEVAFGEGLQLVNILKDESVDRNEGRSYLGRVARSEVMQLARADLAQARVYINALKEGGAPGGFIGFTLLAEELAQATLAKLEREGAGAKISRVEVFEILARVQLETAAPAAIHSPMASTGK
jgi:farnesyl-diphosphate farnesyltransferase